MIRSLLIALLFFSCACQSNRIQIIEQKINKGQIAAQFVNAPYPEIYNDIQGEQLHITYNIEKKHLPASLEVSILYKNLTSKNYSFPITRRISTILIENMNKDFISNQGILSYTAVVISQNDNKPITQYNHKLWVTLIKKTTPHKP